MSTAQRRMGYGPFRVEHLREGDRYELSDGHPIYREPTGRRGGRANVVGGEALDTDPSVESAGIDVGYSDHPGRLRAPDISVGPLEDEPGWARSAPPLAVEYADTGQDESDLQAKIRELLQGGSKHVWVVRLTGPRRVEVHQPEARMRVARPGEELRAPGILRNAVPVLALFDRKAAHEVALRNLLQRKGYENLDSVLATGRAEGEAKGRAEGEAKGRAEGEAKGRAEALLRILSARKLPVSSAQRRIITSADDLELLADWLDASVTVPSVGALLRPSTPRRRASPRARRRNPASGAPRKKR